MQFDMTQRVEMADPRAGFARRIPLWIYRPQGNDPARPLVIVMHGMSRNADEYCNAWAKLADVHGFALVAPEFSAAEYPDARDYNFGNMISEQGALLPRELWLFPIIDQIFLRARELMDLTCEHYCLYGHSAGGQLVHRLATFAWSPRIALAISANAGSYTMPVFDADYPFGLGKTGFAETDMAGLLSRPLTVLLGEADSDPEHHNLPRQPGAMAQGTHRFERGQRYFRTAQDAAASRGLRLAWRLSTVPGVAHSNPDMAPAAAALCATVVRS